MICNSCLAAGRILQQNMDAAGRLSPVMRLTATQLHERCPGATRCDCQHAVESVRRLA